MGPRRLNSARRKSITQNCKTHRFVKICTRKYMSLKASTLNDMNNCTRISQTYTYLYVPHIFQKNVRNFHKHILPITFRTAMWVSPYFLRFFFSIFHTKMMWYRKIVAVLYTTPVMEYSYLQHNINFYVTKNS